jgi:hypothetical protein
MTHGYCTLFDVNFFPQGAAMLESLAGFCPDARLFVLAMDEEVGKLIDERFSSKVTIIFLHEIETADLLRIKPGRSRGEYCWTLTPFLPSFVLKSFPEVDSATYVDADVYFFKSPEPILQELYQADKTVLITDHGYDPQYDQSATSGKFCVQFVVFKRSESAQQVLDWWMSRCIEWCFARHEDGKFGDQKYLDVWPELFACQVHIYSEPWNTLAPWNVEWWNSKKSDSLRNGPIMYHFHGLRIYRNQICCFLNYKIKSAFAKGLYRSYTLVIFISLIYM